MTTKKATHASTDPATEAQTQSGAQAKQQTPFTATDGDGAAVVHASQAPTSLDIDEHSGKGGFYSVVNGQRVLQQRTDGSNDVA